MVPVFVIPVIPVATVVVTVLVPVYFHVAGPCIDVFPVIDRTAIFIYYAVVVHDRRITTGLTVRRLIVPGLIVNGLAVHHHRRGRSAIYTGMRKTDTDLRTEIGLGGSACSNKSTDYRK